MFRSLFIFCILCISFGGFAQKSTLTLKKGSVLTYRASVNGQELEVRMEVDSLTDEYSKFSWSLNGESGSISNGKASTMTATHGYWGELSSGVDMAVGDDQTILFISKSMWGSLQKDKKMTYDDQVYTLKELSDANAYKLKDKLIDVLYVENAGGTSKMWILNNAAAPIILRFEGNPQGVDVELQQFEQK